VNLGLDFSKSGSDVCCPMLLSLCSVMSYLDLLQVLPDFLIAGGISDLQTLVKVVVFLTNEEYRLSKAVVSEDGRIPTGSKLVLGRNLC